MENHAWNQPWNLFEIKKFLSYLCNAFKIPVTFLQGFGFG